ncbi:MAG: hypothetical protein GX234_11360 [Clostridiales bacterium]|nr:hypothetical protein [Clostridiales bacterium]
MNYAWEAALAADETGIPREKIRYVPVGNGSPYAEIVLEMLNAKSIEENRVEINPLYRFSGIFAELFHPDMEEYEQTRNLLFETFMQYMIQLDLRQGLDRQEYALRFLLRDILEGMCGSYASQAVSYFEKRQIHQLMRFILELYRCGSSIHLFRKVMRYLYPDSMVYANREEEREILIYVGVKQNGIEQKRIEFLQEMFLPLYDRIFLFWEYHFGIFDVNETMETDNMVLF